MDKEILIDGVNVAGCDFYELCGCIDDNHELNECKDNPNCYYKQLQRLKEENEEMHERLRTIIYNATGGRLSYSTYTVQAVEQAFYDQLEIETEQRTKELEEENEHLKEFCIELEKQKEKQHNQWFERCTENHNEDSKIIEKYRSVLEEIREILNKECGIISNAKVVGLINEVLDEQD